MIEYRRMEFPGYVVPRESAAALKAAIDALLTSYSHTAKEVHSVLSEAAERIDISPGSHTVIGMLGAAVGGMVAPLERQEEWSRWAAPEFNNDVESVDYNEVQRWILLGGPRPF